MDWTVKLIEIFVTAVVSVATAYITILPQLVKLNKKDDPEETRKIIREEVKKAIAEDETIKEMNKTTELLKKSQMSQMRDSLIQRYIEYKKIDFDVDEGTKHRWDQDFEIYTSLGGNSVVVEMNDEFQVRWLVHREEKKYIKED